MKLSIFLLAILASLNVLAQSKSGIELEHLKINQNLAEAENIRHFYREVLDLKVVSPEGRVKRDYVEFDNGQRINLIYFSDASKVPSKEEFLNGLWIRITVNNFEDKRDKVLATKAKVIRQVDGKELYFQAPGGQVFRMVKKGV